MSRRVSFTKGCLFTSREVLERGNIYSKTKSQYWVCRSEREFMFLFCYQKVSWKFLGVWKIYWCQSASVISGPTFAEVLNAPRSSEEEYPGGVTTVTW